MASAALQAVRRCRRCGVAGGERVPPAPLGWYCICCQFNILQIACVANCTLYMLLHMLPTKRVLNCTCCKLQMLQIEGVGNCVCCKLRVHMLQIAFVTNCMCYLLRVFQIAYDANCTCGKLHTVQISIVATHYTKHLTHCINLSKLILKNL